jgi:hypothetical protein
MKIVMDSVNEITPELLSRTRTSRAVNGRAADPAASRVRERNLVLRQTCRVEGHTPVGLVPRTKSKIEDGSATGTWWTRGTAVADS